MTIPDRILKSKDTNLLTKVCIVKTMLYLDSWAIKKAEH